VCTLGIKKAVASPAVATPKLMDICCIVLAIELALLVSCSVMSRKQGYSCCAQKVRLGEGMYKSKPTHGYHHFRDIKQTEIGKESLELAKRFGTKVDGSYIRIPLSLHREALRRSVHMGKFNR
jgi:hypothetical protein